MQELANKFKDGINARLGRGTSKSNFKPDQGAIFVPGGEVQGIDLASVLNNSSFASNLLRLSGNLPKSFGSNLPNFNNKLPKKATNLNKAFSSNADGIWYDIYFVVSKDIAVTELNNQFFEPLGSSGRGVKKHPQNMRDFGEQTIIIHPKFPGKKPKLPTTLLTQPSFVNSDWYKDAEGLKSAIAEVTNLLSQEKIRMRHPRWGYINVAVDGPISVDDALLPGQGIAFATFRLKEIVAFTDATYTQATPQQKTLSFLEKLENAYSDARDYAFATAAEFTSTVNQLDRVTGAINRVANDISGLSTNIVNSFNAFNRLADSIGRLKGSLKTALNVPKELGKNIKDIFNNFKNVLGLSRKPARYSVDSYNKNITLISSAQTLLSPSSFASDNNILLSSTDPETKGSYELMTIIKHTQSVFLAASLIDEVEFNEVEEIDVVIKQFADVVDSLANYELFLGKDIYKNKITHSIQYITPAIIDMIDAFFVIYNDLMFKLLNERILLSYQNETTVQKMPIIQLLHCLYQDEYDLADTETEHVFYDRLCRLNPKLYTTEPWAEGLIKY